MEGKKCERSRNPEEGANVLSKIFFWWTKNIFHRGLTNPPMTVNELCRPLPEDRSSRLGNRLEKAWVKELKNAKLYGRDPKLVYAVLKAFGLSYAGLAFIHGFNELFLRLIQPIFLGQLLTYFTPNSKMSLNEALIYASAMMTCIFLSSLLGNHYIKNCFQQGMRLRVACSSLIYRKSLKIDKSALGDTASGQVVNLLANDVSRFDFFTVFVHYMWSAPLGAIAVMYYMWTRAGPISLVGVLAILIVVPLQSYTGKLASKFRLQTAYKTDERIRLMDEIICGIQVIKMYAWEKSFSEKVSAARKMELEKLKKSSYIRGLYMTFNLFTTRFSIFCTMIALSLTGGSLAADKIFVYSTYLGMLSFNLSGMYVRGFAEVAESLVSFSRLTKFLVLDEVGSVSLSSPHVQKRTETEKNRGEITLEKATARWQSSNQEATLRNINLEIKKGSLTTVIGPVGGGKSSLIQALLGELKFSEGKVSLSGTLSYCSQEPWVFASSVRQNITFGLPFDKARYAEVVRVCALSQDFSQFPDGDKTIVGDRGASLSGGQRARISLARAIYMDADIYLLDDPLSAVDAHVSKHLFEECIVQFLKDKTRILVTHQLQYLRKADHIVLLDNGAVQHQGKFDSLAKSNFDFAKLFKNDDDEGEFNNKEAGDMEANETIDLMKKVFRQMSNASSRSNRSSKAAELSDSVESLAPIEGTALEKVENNANVSVVDYFLSGVNKFTFSIMAAFFILAQTAASLCDYWMSIWASQEPANLEESLSLQNNSIETFEINFDEWNVTQSTDASNGRIFDGLPIETYQLVYSGLMISVFVVALTRSVIFYNVCIKCSQKLHDLMFVKISRTYMSFFHKNPSGRILNRFSKDLGTSDEILPKVLLDAFQIIMIGVGAVVLTLTVNYLYIVPFFIVFILGALTRYVFVKTSKSLKKIEGVTRGPVFGHLNATLQGITTIRAYRAEETFKNEFDTHQDLHSATMSLFIGVSSAFGFIIDFLCLILITVVTFLLILIHTSLTGGEVGLAVTQILAVTGLVQWGMRQSAEISNQLVSVERVMEYIELESEENLESSPREKEIGKSLKDWPKEGRIEFKNVFLYYDETPSPAIKNLSFRVEPGEKIGIVGRTGAGKTSIISALFRLAKVEGGIVIDDVDTSMVSLQRLRKSISIIPQEPVLFMGNIRKNLDPFENYSDAELWKALEEVELKDVCLNGLDSVVLEGGSNFSVGQKQLVCLARAILRKNQILLLDEATANVDPNTDSLIQKTIRTKFASCTVFTIAHRLHTILDCDKVLVMNEGTVVEFDKPYNLMQIKDGYFTKMVLQTGPAMAEQLRKIAEENNRS